MAGGRVPVRGGAAWRQWIREETLGPGHPQVGEGLSNLAELYRAQGRYAEAAAFHKRALAIGEKALGSEHPDFAIELNNLAELYKELGPLRGGRAALQACAGNL